jgi:rhodanese-related sulfurtransferase
VVEALEARGYDVTNVDGGTNEWVAAGYPVEA